MVKRLSPSEMVLLAPLVVSMLVFVRANNTEAGDLFLGDALDVDDDEVHTVLSELLKSKNAAGGELKGEALDAALATRSAAVWARCAHTLFMSGAPRLVSKEAYLALKQCGKDPAKLRAAMASSVINKNGRLALAELCSMIRDSSIDAECTAMTIAPSVLLPADDGDKDAAKSVMALLVEHNLEVFANKSPGHPESALSDGVKTGGSDVCSLNAKEIRRRNALREFYSWRDPYCVPTVDTLFDNFDFAKIAQGLQQRYSALPGEFVSELEIMGRDPANTKDLEWFVSKSKAVAKKTQRFSMLPRVKTKPSTRHNYKLTRVDMVIDEICITEIKYHDVMQDLKDVYVKHIRAIAEGHCGEQARKDLGLTSHEIESIFGLRLDNVLDVSDTLLAQLSLVSIVSTPPRQIAGRAGLVANIFAKHSDDLRVYAPYISSHMTVIRTLKKCLANLEQINKHSLGRSATKLLNSQAGKKERRSFDKLWDELSNTSTNLKGHSLASILINPVQRVPRYKLFLETLLKECTKENQKGAAVPLAEEALASVKQSAMQINTAVKQHEKLESLFGQESMLSPNNSIVKKDAEGQFSAIINSYVN